MNTIKGFFVAAMAAVSFSASATVIMTDGSLEMYNPSETYVPQGVLGPAPEGRWSSFSMGWIYSDPDYLNILTIQMPSDLIGSMEWIVSSAFDGFGIRYADGFLTAGQRVDLPMGGAPAATATSLFPEFFSMRAQQQIPPIAFGPVTTDTGNGGDPPNPNPVPEPDALALVGLGLLVTAAVTRRRRKADV